MGGRRTDESWLSWARRTNTRVKHILELLKLPCLGWQACFRVQTWAGHVGRLSPSHPIRKLLHWRSCEWWSQERLKPYRSRIVHDKPGKYHNWESQIVEDSGNEWVQRTQHRDTWKQHARELADSQIARAKCCPVEQRDFQPPLCYPPARLRALMAPIAAVATRNTGCFFLLSGDSSVVIRQLTGEWSCGEALSALVAQGRELYFLVGARSCLKVLHFPRAINQKADWAASMAAETQVFQSWFDFQIWLRAAQVDSALHVQFDGASKKNPGLGGCGVALHTASGDCCGWISLPLSECSNNVAEWQGAILAMRWCALWIAIRTGNTWQACEQCWGDVITQADFEHLALCSLVDAEMTD